MLVNFTVNRNDKKYVLDQDGELSEVAVNTPGFEFNIDGSYKGMLVESESENLLTYSEDFRNTADAGETRPWIYTASGTAITPVVTHNYATSPDGTTNATRIQLDLDGGTTSNDNSQIGQNVTITNNTDYSGSIWLKSTDGNSYDIAIDINSSILPSLLATVTNEWQRFDITDTSITTGGFFRIRLRGNEGTSDNADILVYGAQLEESNIATSYMPTTTSTTQRVEDEIYLTSASSYIGQTSGTIYAEIDIERLNINRSIICVRENADPVVNRIFLGITSFNQFYYEIVGDDGDTEISFTTPVTTGIHKLIIVYSSGDTRAYLNGVQIGSSTSSLSFGSTLDIIDIGDDGSDLEPNIFDESTQVFDTSEYYYNVSYFLELNSWIRCFALYKRALSDVEAQRLSLL